MKIVYITAGAAGMYCGSCMRDNTLVAALVKAGHDALLLPTYTPIRTDEEDVSQKRIFFGGINVYLEQKFWLFRHTPWFIDRLFNFPALLRWVSRFAVNTRAEDLGDLTVSMLKGEHGYQQKEIAKLNHWLATDAKPEIINLTNAILSGMVHELKKHLPGVPILCSLQGDDIYTESLPKPHRERCLQLIREHCREIDGFIATSRYYADFMSDYFQIPREKIHVVYPGLNLAGHGGPRPERENEPFTIGYFARICPDKGFHNLIEAYCRFRQLPDTDNVKLRVSGWLGDHQKEYFNQQCTRLEQAGLLSDFEHVECPNHVDKVEFLRSLDVLSVPTTYHEPKGLYILEALANGVPVIQPGHGSFPELIEETGGGIVVRSGDNQHLAQELHKFFRDRTRLQEMGSQGQKAVLTRFTAQQMAIDTVSVYQKYLSRRT